MADVIRREQLTVNEIQSLHLALRSEHRRGLEVDVEVAANEAADRIIRQIQKRRVDSDQAS